jgi:hypothetical protein
MPNDTDRKVQALLIEGYRRMSEAERLQKVFELNRLLVKLMEAEVRHRHPNADEREIRLRVASRWLPPELMQKAFGWNPKERGF